LKILAKLMSLSKKVNYVIDPNVVDRAVALIKNAAEYEYFFNNLTSPDWIQPLKERGFFKNPPEPQEENGYIWFPPWPESRYLARMAGSAPKVVINIILEVPENQNVRVQEDFIDAALQMPASFATKIGSLVSKWLQTPYLLLPSKASELVSYLSKEDEVEVALTITEELLKVLPGQYPFDNKDQSVEIPWKLEPKPRINIWEYEQFLISNLKDLRKAIPYETLTLLSDVLEEALIIQKQDDITDLLDYSEIWLPAIEPHPQNTGYGGVLDLLTTAVRDTAIYVVEDAHYQIETVIKDLETREWTVFRRIALYLVCVFGELNIKLADLTVGNKEYFDDHRFRHEYSLVCRKYFKEIKERTRNRFLRWIQVGPDTRWYIERTLKEHGRRPTNEELQRIIEVWQLRWLSIIDQGLPSNWKIKYEELVEKYGVQEHPDLLSWSSGVKVGPSSPISPDNILEKSVEDLINFLKEWISPSGFMVESPEGLSRALTAAVSKNPSKYGGFANDFIGLEPTYIRGIIAGFREALEGSNPIDWNPVLRLCRWVVLQPRDAKDEYPPEREGRDPHWGWTRKEVARFIEVGLKPGDHGIPFDLNQDVWDVINPITDDPDPSLEDAINEEESSFDPATLSINSARGSAMHCTIRFALWYQRNLLQLDSEQWDEKGLDWIPEVRKILEKHLDISEDASLAIRSVYGWWYGSLLFLDHVWALKHKLSIFPTDEHTRAYWNASWNAFLRFNRPHANLYKKLIPEYRHAVMLLGEEVVSDAWSGNPAERLAEHLMVYYWLGLVKEDSDLFTQFWTIASADIRGHAIEFIGRSLSSVYKDIESEIKERLSRLWEIRWGVVSSSSTYEEYLKELATFGWWFSSGRMDPIWALTHLQNVLSLGVQVDATHQVVEELGNLADRYPLETATALSKIIDMDQRGWGYYLWRDDAKRLLGTVLESDNIEGRQAAEDLIHRLGARGQLDYGELLNS
jgi:hypothetical protein